MSTVRADCQDLFKSDQRLYVLFGKKLLQCSKNISLHFSAMHANYASHKSTQEWAAVGQRLAANLQTQQINFLRQIQGQRC